MSAILSRLCYIRQSPFLGGGRQVLRYVPGLQSAQSPRLLNAAGRFKSTDSKDGQAMDVSTYPLERTRNFSIIAHIDHGKSTLADRLLECTGLIDASAKNKQVLDNLKVEQERGITIKAQTVTLFYNHKGEEYLINLIDTPGHVDFSYEVSRSLAACDGCVLLVDASQGVQAQTVANFYLSFEADLFFVPVLNKIDLKTANVPRSIEQLKSLTECDESEILQMSAKSGLGVDQILPAVIDRIPPPERSDRDKQLRMLVFDSWYIPHRGALCLVAVKDGSLAVGDPVTSAHFQKDYIVDEVGIMHPHRTPVTRLYAGQVGYMLCNMKRSHDARVGDTFHRTGETITPFPGFKPIKPVVFCGIFPVDPNDLQMLTSAMDKLTLNDASVDVQRDASAVLGQGWRLGFLGMLHMEVFTQRLEEEHDAHVICTSPSVMFQAMMAKTEELVMIRQPEKFPDPAEVSYFKEPMVKATLIFPEKYAGKVISLCQGHRGDILDRVYIDNTQLMMKFRLPLAEIVVDFYDKLKGTTSGYASFEYEDDGWAESNLVKCEILLNGEPVDALAVICHRTKAFKLGKAVCGYLKEELPRQLFEIAIQARTGKKIIARETIKAMRKDVTAKCYGGDITRRLKLLSKQKAGKKKMRMVGNIEVPKEVFMKVIKQK
eukprot:scpid48021/ scgid20197/ Translation factor GUF1 homolog, mitochondrial; Elongation factor 4 homolog; GTPase GUF1 homolog; Ribosomal back-translocase